MPRYTRAGGSRMLLLPHSEAAQAAPQTKVAFRSHSQPSQPLCVPGGTSRNGLRKKKILGDCFTFLFHTGSTKNRDVSTACKIPL